MHFFSKQVANDLKEMIKVLNHIYDQQVTFVALCAMIYVTLDHGSGVHQWNIRVKNILSNLPVPY